jgi:hypothetical protein
MNTEILQPAEDRFAPPIAEVLDPSIYEMRPDRVQGGATLTILLEVKNGNLAPVPADRKGYVPVNALAQANGKVGYPQASSFLAWLGTELNTADDAVVSLELQVRGDSDSAQAVQAVLQRLTNRAFH